MDGATSRWFADVQGHTLDENEMVAGADDFLEGISDGKNELTVLTGPMPREAGIEGFQLWICNVTHDVMGEHRRSIYIFDIR